MPGETLAQLVRKKYPRAYDDLSDEQLEQSVRAKFPGVYDDMPVTSETSQPAAPERTWTDTAVDALPMLGGFAGGILGGLGGTVAGMGVGGVPGAVGGAALGGAAGESARQLVNRARGEAAPTTPMDAATAIATEGGLQAGAEVLGGVVGKAAGSTARAVYRGYLKPSLSTQMLPRARAIVQTALDEALPISRGGAQTATRVIGELKREVDAILAKSTDTVDLHGVADKVRRFARARYYKPGVDATDFTAAMEVANKIDAHPSLQLPPGAKPSRIDVSLSQANDVKRAIDTSAKEAAFGVTTGAKKSAEKFARHEINQALQKKAAAIAPLNARESKLIDAAKAISRAVEREANNNQLTGVKTIASGALGGGIGYANSGDPYTAATWALAMRIGLHPAVASRAAIIANRSATQLGIGVTSAARLGIYAAMSSDGRSDRVGKEP